MGRSPTSSSTTAAASASGWRRHRVRRSDQSVGVIEGIRLAAGRGERFAARPRRDPARHDGRDERRPRAARGALRPHRDQRLPADPPPRGGVDPGPAVRVHGLREARAADRHPLRPRGTRANRGRRGDRRADRHGGRACRGRGARRRRDRGADRMPDQRACQRPTRGVVADIAASVAPDLSVSISSGDPPRVPRVRAHGDDADERVRRPGPRAVPDQRPRRPCRRASTGADPGRAVGRRSDETRLGLQEPGADCAVGAGRRRHGASFVASHAGFDRILTFDMGGTSTDVAVCVSGRPEITRETNVGDFPVRAPAVDVASIGAGGGSIAYVADATGALRVGPESAGALPGPACYGRGGTEATVTDANVVLGHLPPRLLGGEFELDAEAAYAAVAQVAEARGTRRRGDRASDREHGRRGDARRAARRHRPARAGAERVRARRVRRCRRPPRERARERSSAATP